MLMNVPRTIVSAMLPTRFEDSFTEIWLRVWFEELSAPIVFCATPTDCERHGVELWFRAMAGEYGPINIVAREDAPAQLSYEGSHQ